MPTVGLNITGPSYPHRSRSLSSQRTVGFYPEIIDTQSKKSEYILNSFPGLKLFATTQGGKDRGMFEYKGILYKVTGTTLHSISQNGTYQALSTITGSKRCIFAGIGDDLVIVSGGVAWYYTVSPIFLDYKYTQKSFSTATEESTPTDVEISRDGTKAYVIGTNSDKVHQYSLSTAYDIETISYDNKSLDTTSEDATMTSLEFNDDGTILYALGINNDSIYQYTLTTAWDISTATYASKSLSVTAEEINPRGFTISDDGTSVYAVGLTNTTIYQYTLTTPWDVSTGAYATKSLSVGAQDTSPFDIGFNVDGTELYLLGSNNDVIYKYTLTTGWDVSTGSYSSESLSISEDTSPQGFVFTHDRKRYYLIGGTNKRIYQYATLGEITDSDLETPNSCAHLNNQIIYDGDGGRFVTSDVGDATTINGLNYATAESNADDLVRVYVFDQILYLMGEKTIESWYNSGAGSPPFDRLEGGIIQVGLAAIYSVANNDRFMYFLGDDNQVYRVSGTSEEHITTNAVTHEIESYTAIADAIGYTFTFDNQHFYMLVFPSENRTWCYSEESGQWFEPNESRYIGSSHEYAFRKNLIADQSNGNIYELDLDTYDENGTLVERFRDTGPIHGGLFGTPGKRIEMNRFELIMETGVGRLPSTEDNREDPFIMLSYSDDGGKTYSTEEWGHVGKMGEYQYKVEWFALGSFEERNMRIKVSDPNFWSIHSAVADIEVGI